MTNAWTTIRSLANREWEIESSLTIIKQETHSDCSLLAL